MSSNAVLPRRSVEPVPAPQTGTKPPRPRRGAADSAIYGAAGLVVIALSFALGRTGHSGPWTDVAFWLGFLTLLTPVALRLLAPDTARTDRILLVVLAGTLTYVVKVLHDPSMFVMGDEWIHLAAAQHLSSAHSLFQPLPVDGANIAAGYPGLEAGAVSLSDVTGLSLFVSGLIVIGVARVIMVLAIFIFVDRVTRSTRVAGLAALLFAANGNFLFWSAQFSYQSLALPLFIATVALLIVRAQQQEQRLPLTLVVVILTIAITATHHLTSYALAIVLWVLTAMSLRRKWRAYRAIELAAFATIAAEAWFLFVATGTRSYLGYVVHRTVTGIDQTVASGGAHVPFQGSAGALQTPLGERIVSYAGVLLITGGVLAALWKHRRFGLLKTPGGVLLALSAVGFLAFYPLRVSPGAWETANRGQEFSFVGGAALLALVVVSVAGPRSASVWRRYALVGGILIVICGGVIGGWPAPLRLPQPLEVRVSGGVVVPQGLEAVRWALRHLGRNAIYVGDEATGRELAVNGARFTYIGFANGVPQLLHDPQLPPWQLAFITQSQIDFVVLDRRKISADNLAGYFFPSATDPGSGKGYFSGAVRQKFADLPTASSVFNSGDIVIYDVRDLRRAPPLCADVGGASTSDGITCRVGGELLTIAGGSKAVTFPDWRVRYLGVDVAGASTQLTVTVRIQFQNLGRRAFLADGDRNHIFLRVGGTRVGRERSVPYRTDDLVASTVVRPAGNVEGSVTFVVRDPKAIAGILQGRGDMYVQAPNQLAAASQSRAQLRFAVIPLGPFAGVAR